MQRKDNYLIQHSLGVTILSLVLGKTLGFNQKELKDLGMGAIVHDIGEVTIPEEILFKASRLTDEEYEIMKTHTNNGFNILRDMQFPLLASHCAFQHHERLDGSGYPRGLKAKDIHKFGKVIAIADTFDALTHDRVYRKAMLPHEAIEILFVDAAKDQFDIEYVNTFKNIVSVYPNGLSVKLSNGLSGVVVQQNPKSSSRPFVRVLTDQEGNDVAEPYESLIITCHKPTSFFHPIPLKRIFMS
jgi:putative nucleotidyltransferase with HDIG domain